MYSVLWTVTIFNQQHYPYLGGGGAGMAQWWERSPPTNVSRIRFPDPSSYVGWVCFWFSFLLRDTIADTAFWIIQSFASTHSLQAKQTPLASELYSLFHVPTYRPFSHDVTATMLLFPNKELFTFEKWISSYANIPILWAQQHGHEDAL